MFVKPAPGNTFWVVRIAVLNHGYSEAPVNEFGFTLKGDNGVEYSSNLISPMVTRSLPSVTIRDGAWEWGYLGFETSKEVRKASLECAGVRNIVVAYDDKETRKALRQVGIAVPANAMPPPTK